MRVEAEQFDFLYLVELRPRPFEVDFPESAEILKRYFASAKVLQWDCENDGTVYQRFLDKNQKLCKVKL